MRIKQLRKENNLLQEEIAKILNITQEKYSRIETQVTAPDIYTLIKLADYYAVSLDYLCEHKTDMLDISFYNKTAKQIIQKLPNLSQTNLDKLEAVCDGLILGQKN